jgi:DNA-binding NarL/FixJ family response regulator
MKIWKILIVDNHPVARAGLKLVLEATSDFKVIGCAASGQEAIQLCQELQPDIILMDVNMPDGNGVETTQILHGQYPQLLIIGVSGYQHVEIQQEIVQAGAAGYISKETDFVEMVKMIKAFTTRAINPVAPNENPFHLTPSEQKVLYLLAEGYDRQQIADDLAISLNTVKMHIRNLYQKLSVANAADAIKMAIEHHLIS